MLISIDRDTYNKAARYPIGTGYDRRPKGLAPSSILVHSTNNRNKTTFAGEAKYLFESAGVSAHYLIGKTEQDGVVQFLDDNLRAWHAGMTTAAYLNSRSIGIEMHISLGERPTAHQISALTELCAGLMHRHKIPQSLIETHRAAALPPGRKRDPEGIDQIAFLVWRRRLIPAPLGTEFQRYRVKVTSARIRNKPSTRADQVGSLTKGKFARGQLVVGQALDDGGKPNALWLKMDEGKYIWSGLLEVAK
jgi:hypothetical protein